MEIKLKLMPRWKAIYGILGIAFLYVFARSVYSFAGSIRYFFSQEITRFYTAGMVFSILMLLFSLSYSGFVIFFFLYKFRMEHVLVTHSRIEYKSFGYILCSNWANTKQIASIGTLGLINGIYIIPDSINKWVKLPIKWLVNINSRGEYFIPLSTFDDNWRDSELGQQIKQYAPHLFQ